MSDTANNAAERTTPAQPPTKLTDFLATRDVPCPGCGYNLRGITIDTCPECGTALELEKLLRRPYRETAGIVVTVTAAWIAFAFSLPLFMTLMSVPYTLGCGVIGVLPHTKIGRRWLWLARDGQRRAAVIWCWVFLVFYPVLPLLLWMFLRWM